MGGRGVGLVAVACALAVVAAGCTGSRGAAPSPSPAPTVTPAPTPPPGAVGSVVCTPTPPRPSPTGSVRLDVDGHSFVFGAEGWPNCLNPITGCGANAWTWYTVLEHVLPRAMQLDPESRFVPSPLLVEAPSFENGGLTEDPFTVRFRISDDAVWEDGSPITSKDFRFTWRAIVSTKQAYPLGLDGYDFIEGIDTADPRTAVIRFTQPYPDWPNLFGGERGFVLKAAAFPNVAREENPDLSHEMSDSIPFSGGPWILQSWSQDQAVLVRNDEYVGQPAKLDQATFVPRTDHETEIESIATGEVLAIYPQPSEASLLNQIGGFPGVCAFGGPSTTLETLWFQLDRNPLTESLVRQALLYALDRQSVVQAIPSLNDPSAAVVNCGIPAVPRLGPWCRDRPFEPFTFDPARSRQLLTEAGYDCSSTPCVKRGKPLRVRIGTDDLSRRRVRAEDILIAGARDAGFELVAENWAGDFLFGEENVCFLGGRAVDVCTLKGSVDPLKVLLFASLGDLMSCGPGGRTSVHWCNAEASHLISAVSRIVDPAVRLDTMSLIYQLEANDAVGLPLYALPAVSAWRSDEIEGPIGLWNGTPYGLFFNMNEWYMAP
jgi:peptide/nickel transport system substrate-binding protein